MHAHGSAQVTRACTGHAWDSPGTRGWFQITLQLQNVQLQNVQLQRRSRGRWPRAGPATADQIGGNWLLWLMSSRTDNGGDGGVGCHAGSLWYRVNRGTAAEATRFAQPHSTMHMGRLVQIRSGVRSGRSDRGSGLGAATIRLLWLVRFASTHFRRRNRLQVLIHLTRCPQAILTASYRDGCPSPSVGTIRSLLVGPSDAVLTQTSETSLSVSACHPYCVLLGWLSESQCAPYQGLSTGAVRGALTPLGLCQ